MPIYEYCCQQCGHACEKLESVHAPTTQLCDLCGEHSLTRQISHTHFKLKGQGWYETDFKNPSPKKEEAPSDKTSKGDASK